MKGKKLRYVGALLVYGFCLQQPVLAYDIPETIRIGLESVAKDTSQITITSEERLVIGYFEGDRWYEEEQLSTDAVTVEVAGNDYFMYDESFETYDDAYDALDDYDDATVAYVQPGEYRIYTTDEARHTEEVGINRGRIAVYDEHDDLLFISENDKQPLGFQGAYDTYDFEATGIKDRRYRGVIEVVQGQYKGLTAVSVLDFEEYLYGVVNNEMGGSNPEEALKAQAVASRSMAAYQYGRFEERGYDLVDTTSSQVYRGITSEHSATTDAVDATRGEVAVYNGELAETVYCASSGGHTANVKYVWGSERPYLSGVPDPYEENNHDWTRTITLEEIEDCLDGDGINIGRVEGLEIVEWTPDGRVKELKVLGSKGEHSLTRELPRTFFHASEGGSLKSTMFKFTPYDGSESFGKSRTKVAPENSAYFVLAEQNAVVTELGGLYVEDEDRKTRISDDNTLYAVTKDGSKRLTTDLQEDEETNNRPEPDEPFDPGDEKTVVYGDVTLYGKGYGHGVGMSQNGAIAMAEAGYDYDEIIVHYYSGVEID